MRTTATDDGGLHQQQRITSTLEGVLGSSVQSNRSHAIHGHSRFLSALALELELGGADEVVVEVRKPGRVEVDGVDVPRRIGRRKQRRVMPDDGAVTPGGTHPLELKPDANCGSFDRCRRCLRALSPPHRRDQRTKRRSTLVLWDAQRPLCRMTVERLQAGGTLRKAIKKLGHDFVNSSSHRAGDFVPWTTCFRYRRSAF